LHTLMSTVTTTASVGYHARIVADLAVRRRLLAAGHRIVQLAGSATSDVDAVTAEAEAALAGVTDTRGTTFQRLEDLVGPTLDTLEGLSSGGPGQGIRTGFIDLDRLLNGLHPGQVIVIGGRPGGGKSTFGLDLLRACAVKQDLPAAFFSFEMGAEEIVMRLLSAEARVPLHLMRSGGMDDGAWSRLSQRMGEVSVAPLFIDDSPNMTMSDVRAKARRLVHRHGVKLICIDYLQLVTTGRKTENRQQEVSEMSRAFKLLAKELQVPILLLSQLNRGSEQRTDKRPMLSDLRESGAVEQDADVVILLHRPDMHDPDDRPGEADLIVAKQRNGATGTLPVVFQGSYSRFVDFAS
ncbi:MAG: replicative helicase, partial [Flaviaesturariibacter sp.]|nr:replicative helicase [Flaviaesturariibacter sp.]